MASWVIGYGFVQAAAPGMVKRSVDGLSSEIRVAQFGAFVLTGIPVGIVVVIQLGLDTDMAVVGGLALFGIAFAINSSVHSYLILAFTDSDEVALNVGFYYMANAGGRLVGSLLSGLSYQFWNLSGCLLTTSVLLAIAGLITILLSGEKRDVVAGRLTD